MNKLIKFLISLNDLEVNIFRNTEYNKDNPYNGKYCDIINLSEKEIEYKELRHIWNILAKNNNSNDKKIRLNHYYMSPIVIEIKELSLLSSAYKLIRNVYPDYKYKLIKIFPFGKYVDVTWGDKNYPLIDIELCTKITEFPKELISENCGFEKEQVTNYRYVCH